ncbi:uncharacterized protein FOMMEDRAFT_162448 [Fomitiporia mediterranea MF3/22]|uniref:uncharacterized protein n=1 Tax=Fomitiporia mediterranea (strain MF3/22) TaxID=694068 RepID=UPI0004407CB1|nr:uncharacterized protein FOMMEDRAFT_162448 [Fomitiporia mediterranea MF3/22]EJC98096.1 hypothetical protein FOMMEDRAFT_162448 [Fomitiporia mediterranea MF3/22]
MSRTNLTQFLRSHQCRRIGATRYVNAHTSSRRKYATNSVASSTAGPQDPEAYCREFVRKHDRDSYLTSQFFPKALQPACFAVRAFYLELAMIQDSVSNPLIGQMRMQFWKDAIQQPGASPHPIAVALHNASKGAHIAPYHLRRIIEARDIELNSPSHLNMDTLLAHAESTTSTLNYILLSILGLSSSDTYSHAASHIGVSQTVSTLLRALPYHASKGVMVIPASITAKHHVNQEEVFRRGPAASGLQDAVYEFAIVANDHLITARDMFKGSNGLHEVPREAMSVFLNAVPVQNYLRRLEKANFDAFNPKLQLRDSIRLPWQIWRSYYKSEF